MNDDEKSIEYIKIISKVVDGKKDVQYEPLKLEHIKAEVIGDMLDRSIEVKCK